MEEAIFALYNAVLPDSESDIPYSLPPEPRQECIASLDTFRKTTCELAGGNIKTEQLRQKRQYDKKSYSNKVCNAILLKMINYSLLFNT